MPTNLVWVDYVIVGILALSMLAGLLRGLLKEAISLGAWIAAFFVAFMFVEDGAAYLTRYIGIPAVRIILAFGVLLLCTLIVGGLINLIVAQLLERTGLTVTDRLLGLIFGLIKGGAIVTVLVLLAGLTPLPQNAWWKQSVLLPHFQPAAVWLRARLPTAIAENFKFPES
ncbi:MAG: CvpA family protein [Candidatus Competibacteraceae bacterium]